MGILEAITTEDRHYVKRYIIIPLIIAAFERDCRYIKEHLKTPEPYVDAIKPAIERAWADLREVKKHFFFKGLKVYEEKRTRLGILAKFKCRGYESKMELRWEYIAAEASIMMRKYMGLDISSFYDPTLPEQLKERY